MRGYWIGLAIALILMAGYIVTHWHSVEPTQANGYLIAVIE